MNLRGRLMIYGNINNINQINKLSDNKDFKDIEVHLTMIPKDSYSEIISFLTGLVISFLNL